MESPIDELLKQRADEVKMDELARLLNKLTTVELPAETFYTGSNMTGTTICVLSDSAAAPVASSIAKFKDEYLALIRRAQPAAAAV